MREEKSARTRGVNSGRCNDVTVHGHGNCRLETGRVYRARGLIGETSIVRRVVLRTWPQSRPADPVVTHMSKPSSAAARRGAENRRFADRRGEKPVVDDV